MTVSISKPALNLREELIKAGVLKDAKDVFALKSINQMLNTTAVPTFGGLNLNGNFLVGKTAIGFATDGFEARSSGLTGASATSAAALNINRNTTDGDLAIFYKDGTTVGSIGSASGGLMGLGTGDTGIKFYATGNAVMPANPSSTFADRNGAIDLGYNGNAFKNLYLSGGVYLGGTGAANLLDDYEEGTFTPTVYGLTTTGTVTYNAAVGSYIKVGNLVHVQLYLAWTSHTGTGDMVVGGLPFTVASYVTKGYAGATIGFANNLTWGGTNATPMALFKQNDTYIEMKYSTSGATIQATQVDGAADLILSGTYYSA